MPIYFPTTEEILRSQLLTAVSAHRILVHVVPKRVRSDITQPLTHLDHQHFLGPGPYRYYVPLKVGYRALHRIVGRWLDQGYKNITEVEFEPGAERWLEIQKLVVEEIFSGVQPAPGETPWRGKWPWGSEREENKEETEIEKENKEETEIGKENKEEIEIGKEQTLSGSKRKAETQETEGNRGGKAFRY